ncbi:intraflagellar transport protein 81 homolog [Mytilus californianus]|uniref:intraflagellar transport protein 81 homolog n=1 Tax=Mytilus californianus TaxID=6549 RepID=UPI002246545F|nr:intraflagellar transport protein 81 homolog [Mytilus californianus]
MSEQLKFITQELKKEPFSKTYNLISFDSLEPLQLLQVLNDIIAVIDPKQKLDIREESPDQTAIRIFTTLRVLKYKPPNDDVSTFRAGLVQGDKLVIYPILEWLLTRVPDLQKRAYLARFLVKIDVPSEIMADEGIPDLYAQYEELMDQFKDLHKQAEKLRSSGFNTGEIRKDISNMEDEKEQLNKRIERLKRKVESHPNSQTMMNVARNLRLERDKEKKLAEQRQEQATLIQHEEQKIRRLQQQLHDQRQTSVGANPDTLLQRLEEETRTNKYIVTERLPKDITGRRKTLQDLQRVVAEPAMGHSDLDQLNSQISELNSEINQLMEKRMLASRDPDDKSNLFRQQASIIAHKKEAAVETYRGLRDEYNHIQQEIEQKRDMIKEQGGGEVLKGEDFKRYVNKLRSKSTIYKKKRQEIAEIRAEVGVLSRTEEILRQRDENMNMQLSALENKKGVAGYRQTQEDLEKVSSVKSEYDDRKGKTLEDMSDMVTRMNRKIAEKKGALAPIIKELRPLRQRNTELTAIFEEKKHSYETANAGLESNMAKLEQEVRGYHEECKQEESRYHYLNCMIRMIEMQQQKVADEMKAYTSSDPYTRKKTFRELYQRKVQEQENLGKGLREQQKTVRESHGPSMTQMKMWKDLERLMECKRQCMERNAGMTAQGISSYGEAPPAVLEDDRLVL